MNPNHLMIHERLEALSQQMGRDWTIEQTPEIFDATQTSFGEQIALQTGLLFIRIGQKLIEANRRHSHLIRKTA